MAKSRGRKFAEITTPTNGVFDLTSVPTITNAKLQNSAMTLAGSSVSLGGTGVANTDALSEGSSNVYFTDARVQTFLGGGTLAGNIVVPDNRSIYVGSQSDFRIIHNTTNTQLTNTTGALQITSSGALALSGSAVAVTGATTFSSTIAATGAITAGSNITSGNDVYVPNGRFFRFTAASSSSSGGFLFGDSAGTGGSIAFKRNADSSTILHLDADGKVGIGTASLTDLLTVGGVASPRIGIQSTSGSGDAGIEFGDNSDDNVGYLVYDHSANAFRFGTNTVERVRIHNNGYVGINTGGATPSHPLEINTNAGGQSDAILITNQNVATNNTAGILFAPSNGIAGARIEALATEDFSTTANRTADLLFYTRKDGTLAERVRIDGSGNVGIGTVPVTLLNTKGATLTATTDKREILIEAHSDGSNNSEGALTGITFRNSPTTYTASSFNRTSGIYGVNQDSGNYGRSMGLAFYTSTNDATASEAMRIRNDGNVGIGNSNPICPLSVGPSAAGNVANFRGGTYNQVNISHANNSSWGLLLTNSDSASNASYHYSPSGQNKSCAIVNVNNDALHFGTNNTQRMTIEHGGDVGIGTSSPESKLDVTRGTDNTVYSTTADQRSEATITVRNASQTTGTFAGIHFYAGAGTGADWSINNVRTGSYAGDLTFKTRAGGGSTDWRERMRILNNGKVGIGPNATSPVHYLHLSDTSGSNDVGIAFTADYSFVMGADTSDQGNFKISRLTTTLGTNDAFTVARATGDVDIGDKVSIIATNSAIIQKGGSAQYVQGGEFCSFNSGSYICGQGGNTDRGILQLHSSVSSGTGTVYVACENSGQNVVWGYIIDFFFSNNSFSTTIRENGNSQSTTTPSMYVDASRNVYMRINYAGGLGGNIRVTAAGHVVCTNY